MRNPKEHPDKISCFILCDASDEAEKLGELLTKITSVKIVGKSTDPPKAIHTIARLKPEMVFLEVVMSQMTGFEVMAQIRENALNPCFAFVTDREEYTIRAIKANVFDYLLRPLDIEELKATIARYQKMRPLYKQICYGRQPDFQLLTSREKEILRCLVEGQSSQEIAEKLCISKNTVDTHRRKILEKTGLKSTSDLIRHYISRQI
jgi:DNA-binding NarL/FixJ family response regulator